MSSRGEGSRVGKGKVTIKRYRVPDPVVEDDREQIIISRREGEGRERDYREIRYEREVEREAPARPREYRRRESSPEIAYEREVTREPQRREPYELERYSRTTDYYSRPEPQRIIIRQEAPQPIIIRERAPTQEIIVREERRPEPKYEMVERARSEERQVARRPERREPEEEEDEEDDEYYYQRTTRQVQRRGGDDYEEEDTRSRRDIDPRDSASQYARSEYSDDEYYYRRTDRYDDYDGGRGRDRSPEHRRHLAEGAVAGLGAAALLRHHKKKQGEKPGGVGQLLGGAALGTIGAELVTRARNQYEDNRSRSRGRGERGGSRSQSRSRPALAKFGAVAAIGAIAAYALTKSNKNAAQKEARRSRSRRRRGSTSRGRSSSSSDAQDPKHRGTIMAKAGLATAAVAGLVERARSKSRGPDAPERTKLRAGAPIIAAGLGGAALAGLYENNKATKQKTKQKERPKKKESSRSRSRSRARSGGDQTGDTGPLVEYGGEPIPTQDYYNRPRSRADSYYSDDSGARGDRRRGSPGSSTSSSPPRARLKERSQSRGRDSVDAAAAGAAAHEADQRRERRRAQRERRRQEEEGGETPNGDPYAWGPYAQAPPPQQAAGQYPTQPEQQYYPNTNNFPPPPPNVYSPGPASNFAGPQSSYNPYQPPAAVPTYSNDPNVVAAAAIPGDPYFLGHPQQHDLNRNPGAFDSNERRRGNNVSRTPPDASSASSSSSSQDMDGDHIDDPTPATQQLVLRRTKSVQFDLPNPKNSSFPSVDRSLELDSDGSVVESPSSPDQPMKKSPGSSRYYDQWSGPPKPNNQRRHSEVPRGSKDHRNRRADASARRHRSASPMSSDDSDKTIVLPDRFDRQGRKKRERGDDPMVDKIEDLLNGQGVIGKLLKSFTGRLLDGNGGGTSGRR